MKERCDYYSNIAHKEFAKKGENFNIPLTKKELFCFGFLQAVERGRPLDFDKKDKAYQNGVIAGEKAKLKSENIKF